MAGTYREIVKHEAEGEGIKWYLEFDQQLQHDDAHQHKEYAKTSKRHVPIYDIGVLHQITTAKIRHVHAFMLILLLTTFAEGWSKHAYPILEQQNKQKGHEGNDSYKNGSVYDRSGNLIGSGVVPLRQD